MDLALAHRLTAKSRPHELILVQEKLDGSCVSIERQHGELRAVGREGTPCDLSPNPNRRQFALWLEQHQERFCWLQQGERLICEWLPVAHGTRYHFPHEPLVVLDLFDGSGVRLILQHLTRRLGPWNLMQPRLLHAGEALSTEKALHLLGDHGHHGALDPAEGVVYRLEHQGKVLSLAKHVRSCKTAGLYLSDHSGLPEVLNSWQEDSDAQD